MDVLKLYDKVKKLNIDERLAWSNIYAYHNKLLANDVPCKYCVKEINGYDVTILDKFTLETDVFTKGELRDIVTKYPYLMIDGIKLDKDGTLRDIFVSDSHDDEGTCIACIGSSKSLSKTMYYIGVYLRGQYKEEVVEFLGVQSDNCYFILTENVDHNKHYSSPCKYDMYIFNKKDISQVIKIKDIISYSCNNSFMLQNVFFIEGKIGLWVEDTFLSYSKCHDYYTSFWYIDFRLDGEVLDSEYVEFEQLKHSNYMLNKSNFVFYERASERSHALPEREITKYGGVIYSYINSITELDGSMSDDSFLLSFISSNLYFDSVLKRCRHTAFETTVRDGKIFNKLEIVKDYMYVDIFYTQGEYGIVKQKDGCYAYKVDNQGNYDGKALDEITEEDKVYLNLFAEEASHLFDWMEEV